MSKFFTATPAKAKLNHKKDNEIYAIFSFDTPSMPDNSRPPVDIAVAMDTSSSMSGERLRNAKKSLQKLIEHLTAQDRLSIVSFNSIVETVLEPTFMTREAKVSASTKVSKMRAVACTNLSGGVLKALRFLQTNPQEGAIQKCLLFTDGQANEGIFKPEPLMQAINEERKNITISSFGYGTGYNETVLDAVSQGGSLYYIDTPDSMLTAFGTELGGLINTFAQNVEVTLNPANGVEILEVLNDFDVRNNGQATIVSLDDLLAEQQFHLVLKLKTDACDPTKHPIKLVTGEVRYFNTFTRDRSSEVALLKAQFVSPDSASSVDNPTVMNEVAIEKLVQAQRKATNFANIGDFEQAKGAFDSYTTWGKSIDVNPQMISISESLAAQYGTREVYTRTGGKLGSSVSYTLKRRRPMGTTSHSKSLGGVDLDQMFENSLVAGTAESFTIEGDAESFTINKNKTDDK